MNNMFFLGPSLGVVKKNMLEGFFQRERVISGRLAGASPKCVMWLWCGGVADWESLVIPLLIFTGGSKVLKNSPESE